MLACFCEHEASYQAAFTDFIDAGNMFTEKDLFTLIEPMMANAGKAIYRAQMIQGNESAKVQIPRCMRGLWYHDKLNMMILKCNCIISK